LKNIHCNKNNIIYITIEIARRELTGKLMIVQEAIKNNFTCILGSRFQFMKYLPNMPIGTMIVKSATNIDLPYIRRIKNLGNNVVCLDEEGLVQLDWTFFFENRVTNETLLELDQYFTWGENQRIALCNQYPELKNKIHVTGNPRVNYWKNYKTNDQTRDLINKKYGEYVLFPTSFGPYNHSNGVKARLEMLKSIYKLNDKKLKWHYDYSLYVKNELETHIKLIKRLDKTINKNIVIKIHPSENESFWYESNKDLRNIYIDKSFSTSDLISCCSAVMQSESTTAIESYLQNKKVFAFSESSEKIKNKFQLTLPALVSKEHNDFGEFSNCLNSINDNSNHQLNKKIDYELNSWMNLHQQNHAKNIIERIKKLPTKHVSKIIELKPHNDYLAFMLSMFLSKPSIIRLFTNSFKERIIISKIANRGNIYELFKRRLNHYLSKRSLLNYFPFTLNWVSDTNKIKYGKKKLSGFNKTQIEINLKSLVNLSKISVKYRTNKLDEYFFVIGNSDH
jgi:surface carbohydrate biosynthesis protein